MGRGYFQESLRGAVALVLVSCCALVWASVAVAEETTEDEIEKGWTGSLALSFAAQTGTVDSFSGSAEAGAERTWEKDHVGIRLTGVYGTSRDRKNEPANRPSSDDTTADSQTLKGDWKHTIHERWFWNSDSSVSRDSTQDLKVRARVATGPGYRFWEGGDAPKEHFDLSAGLGYRYESYDGNRGGTVDENSFDKNLADIIAAFEYKNLLFDGKIEYSHTGSAAMPANDINAYIITSEIIGAVPLTDAWSFRTGLFYEYVNDVPQDVNPSTFRVTLGFGYDF